MTPAEKETCRRMAAEVLAQFIQDSGGDGETAIRFVEASTEWPRESVEARLAKHFRTYGRKPTFDPQAPDEPWEATLEEMLCLSCHTSRERVSAKLDAITSDFPESSPSHSIAQKLVLCVLKLTGWTERQAKYLVKEFVEFSQFKQSQRRKYFRQLSVGKSLGWFVPGANVSHRTPGTLAKNSKGEGPKRKHAHNRTPRTCFIPYYDAKQLNDSRASSIEPSSTSPESAPPDPLPLDLVREIKAMAESYEDDHGAPPNALCIDPALVNGQETVLGLRVVPSTTGLQVAEI